MLILKLKNTNFTDTKALFNTDRCTSAPNVSRKIWGKITTVFPTLFDRSSLLFISLKIFRGRHGDLWLKNDVLPIMFFFLKSRNVKFNVARWRYISLLKLKSTTTKMGLKNRLNILLHTIWGCYTHFSGDYILISMTIYNFRYLYDILHHLEKHSVCLGNLRYKVVYIF